jgi:hypothetical protein
MKRSDITMKINRKTWKYKYITSVILYLKETWKNKLAALLMVAVGVFMLKFDNDITILVMALIFAIPLFLAVEDWFLKAGD